MYVLFRDNRHGDRSGGLCSLCTAALMLTKDGYDSENAVAEKALLAEIWTGEGFGSYLEVFDVGSGGQASGDLWKQ